MKRFVFTVLLAVLVVSLMAQAAAPVLAQAGGLTIPNLLPLIAPLIVAIISPLLARLFKKMGIDIEESQIDPILMRLIEIIANVEAEKKGLSGAQKKEQVTSIARNVLPLHEQQLLVKRFGSLETAVQAAFERSSTAKKKSVRAVAQ